MQYPADCDHFSAVCILKRKKGLVKYLLIHTHACIPDRKGLLNFIIDYLSRSCGRVAHPKLDRTLILGAAPFDSREAQGCGS
jgi:hypothetical protein